MARFHFLLIWMVKKGYYHVALTSSMMALTKKNGGGTRTADQGHLEYSCLRMNMSVIWDQLIHMMGSKQQIIHILAKLNNGLEFNSSGVYDYLRLRRIKKPWAVDVFDVLSHSWTSFHPLDMCKFKNSHHRSHQTLGYWHYLCICNREVETLYHLFLACDFSFENKFVIGLAFGRPWQQSLVHWKGLRRRLRAPPSKQKQRNRYLQMPFVGFERLRIRRFSKRNLPKCRVLFTKWKHMYTKIYFPYDVFR